MEKDSLEALLAEGLSVERIAKRFRKHPSTVAYWMGKYGLQSPLRDKHAARGGVDRSRLEELVNSGLSITQLATELGLSKATVRYWLGRYGLKTRRTRRTQVVTSSREGGVAVVTLMCARHGETEFVVEGSGYYRCKRCRSDQVTRRRRKVKEILVREAGGRCAVCGYDRSYRALEFHHLDPAEKRLQLSAQGVTLALDVLRDESRKCVLLCSNCHAEVEDGSLELPLEFSSVIGSAQCTRNLG